MAIKGGVVSLSIAWHCDLDYDFMTYCLPRYNFRILDDFGWNFRHAKYHEEHRRTLYKMYGIKVRRMEKRDWIGSDWIELVRGAEPDSDPVFVFFLFFSF